MKCFYLFGALTSFAFSQEIEYSCSGGMTANRFEQFKNRYNLDIFIETGTYYGGTTATAAPFFKTIYTIELSNSLYDIACNNLKSYKNVYPILGCSEIELEGILEGLGNVPSLVFLDAHYSAGSTSKGIIDPPLLLELLVIRDHIQDETVVIMDDVRCFSSKFINTSYEYPKLLDIKSYIDQKYPSGFGFYIIGDQALIYNPAIYKDEPSEGIKLLTDLYVEENISRFLEISKFLPNALSETEKEAIFLMIEKGTNKGITCLAMLYYIGGLIADDNKLIQMKVTEQVKSSQDLFDMAKREGMSTEVFSNF